MALTREQILVDLRKARFHRIGYIVGSIGLAVLAVGLIIGYFVKVPRHDIVFIIFTIIAIIFSVLMFTQLGRTREQLDELTRQLSELPDGENEQSSDNGPDELEDEGSGQGEP
jgi:hypothetical protein